MRFHFRNPIRFQEALHIGCFFLNLIGLPVPFKTHSKKNGVFFLSVKSVLPVKSVNPYKSINFAVLSAGCRSAYAGRKVRTAKGNAPVNDRLPVVMLSLSKQQQARESATENNRFNAN